MFLWGKNGNLKPTKPLFVGIIKRYSDKGIYIHHLETVQEQTQSIKWLLYITIKMYIVMV